MGRAAIELYDSKSVVINGEVELHISRGVDDSDSIDKAGLHIDKGVFLGDVACRRWGASGKGSQRTVVVTDPVDQSAVRGRFCSSATR